MTTASLLLAAAVAVAAAVLDLMTEGPPLWSVLLAVALIVAAGQLAQLGLPFRQRSTTLLGAAAGVLAVVLAAGIGALAWLLVAGRLPLAIEQPLVDAALVGVLTAGVVSAVLVPVALRLARSAPRGRQRAPTELLAGLNGQVEAAGNPADLLRDLAESLRRSLRLRAVEIWTGAGSSLEPTVLLGNSAADRNGATGRPMALSGEPVRVLSRTGVSGRGWLELWLPQLLAGRANSQLRLAPAVHGGTVLALLLVERAADDDQFTAADERLLGEVAARLAIVLRNRALNVALQHTLEELQIANDELRASRARLVASSDAERRRIERDLHDGAQQHLVALAVSINLLRAVMPEMTADQDELVAELDTGVRSTIAELRNLAHGIYPPLLRDAGLGSALTAAARRSPAAVTVRAALANRYQQDVEAAIYFCCLEGLQNAGKHAPAAQVVISITEDSTADGLAGLAFSVSDDGPGFDREAARSGAGLINMTDRIGAIGGRISWDSAPGRGTTVTGWVPALPVRSDRPVVA